MSEMNTWTVEALMAEAVRCIASGDSAQRMALDDYRRAGEALTLAREECPWGHWQATLNDAGIAHSVANRYIRLAHYWDQIPDSIKSGVYSKPARGGHRSRFMLAMQAIDHLPKTRSAPHKRDPYEWMSLARKAKADGMTHRDIAELVGMSPSVVQRALNPRSHELETQRKKEQRAARKALERQREREERDRLARRSGGELAEAYSLVRKALSALDRGKTGLDAMVHLHRAEDVIVAALRAERQDAA